MNQSSPENKSQIQNTTANNINVGRDFTFAPQQIETYIETQVVEISAEKVTQQLLIKASPYKGLKRFNFGDRDYFFGRDALIAKLFNAVNRSSFSLVLGASGSGKSSVVRAGLIPELKKSLESQKFYDLIFTPNQDPFESLHRCLLSEEKDYKFTESEAKVALEAKPDTISQVISTLKKEKEKWFLFIDQFEQLFTICTDLEKRKNFIEGIVQVTKKGDTSVRIVLAMRSDFLEQFSFYPTIGTIANQNNIHLVTEMYPDELRQAIEQPAAKHGVVFEKGLVEQIIKEVEGQSGYLPLLQYTLNLLWERECRTLGSDGRPHIEDRTLNKTSYGALGGVRGALQKRVDEIYKDICQKNEDGELITKQIFLKLVNIVESDSGSRAVSRRAYRYEFVGEAVEKTLQKFVDENLLVSSYEYSSEDKILLGNSKKNIQNATVEIAHEILLSSWDKLKRWLEEEKEIIILKNWLAGETRRWLDIRDQDNSKGSDELLKGSRLDQIVEFREKNAFEKLGGLVKEENEFIDASVEWRDRLQAEETRRRKRTILTLSVFSIIALSLSVLAGLAWQRERQQRIRTFIRELSALAQSVQSEDEKLLEESVLLAIESKKRAIEIGMRPLQADQALRQGIALLPRLIARLKLKINADYDHQLTFSSDSKYLASVSDAVRLVEVSTGKEITQIAYKKGVTLSQSGKYAAVPIGDNTVQVQDLFNNQEIASISHPEKVTEIIFSPNDKYIVLAGKTNKQLWKLNPSQEVIPVKLLNLQGMFVFSSDGEYLAEFTEEGGQVWSIASSQKVFSLEGITGFGSSAFTGDQVFLSSEGKYLIASTSENIKVWDVFNNREIKSFDGPPSVMTSMDLSPNGQYLAMGNRLGGIVIVEIPSGEEVAIVKHSNTWVKSLNFSPSGKYLAMGGGNTDTFARIIEIPSGREVARITEEARAGYIVFSPDDKYLARYEVSPDEESNVDFKHHFLKIWKANDISEVELATSSQKLRINNLTISPDSKYFAISFEDGSTQIWNAENEQEVFRLKHEQFVQTIFSPDSKLLVSIDTEKKPYKPAMARIWDLESGLEIEKINIEKNHQLRPEDIVFSADSKYLMILLEFKSLRFWEIDSRREINPIKREGELRGWGKLSLDGKYLAIYQWEDDGTLLIKEFPSEKEIRRINIEENFARLIRGIVFSPDGKYVAVFGGDSSASVPETWDGIIQVWKISSGKKVMHKELERLVSDVAFNPDNNFLAARIVDNTTRVWNLTGNQEEVVRIRHNDLIDSSGAVVFSPDNKYLITIDERYVPQDEDSFVAKGQDVRIWLWETEDQIREACIRLTRNLTQGEWQQYLHNEPYRKTCPNLP